MLTVDIVLLRAWLVALADHARTLSGEPQQRFISRALRQLGEDFPVWAIVEEWTVVRMEHLTSAPSRPDETECC